MRFKLILSLLILILAPRPVKTVDPTEWHFTFWNYGNYATMGIVHIPGASSTSHVTEVELGLTTSGTIYTVNIFEDGVALTEAPPGTRGCPLSGTKVRL